MESRRRGRTVHCDFIPKNKRLRQKHAHCPVLMHLSRKLSNPKAQTKSLPIPGLLWHKRASKMQEQMTSALAYLGGSQQGIPRGVIHHQLVEGKGNL
eukprot:1151098-Pelagomonas_calceolata.AAC.6